MKRKLEAITVNNTQQNNEHELLRKHHRFLRSEREEDEARNNWEKRIATRYEAELYKEYAVVNLSRYKHKQVALRWRTEKEVLTGKGQQNCASLDCAKLEDLETLEVCFGYTEAGIKKKALVKIRICARCKEKLQNCYDKKLKSIPEESSNKISS